MVGLKISMLELVWELASYFDVNRGCCWLAIPPLFAKSMAVGDIRCQNVWVISFYSGSNSSFISFIQKQFKKLFYIAAPCVIPTVAQGTVIAMEKELDPNATTQVTPTLPPSSNQVIHGTTLEVVCEDHYEFPITSSSPPTCLNGTWSIIPRCTPARCKSLPKPPKFGTIILNNISIDMYFHLNFHTTNN